MAKVKIQGHASGTGVFTVTAPNSNTDRTITLPDADVTLGTDATKLPLAGGTMTGSLNTVGITNTTGASDMATFVTTAGNREIIIKSTAATGNNTIGGIRWQAKDSADNNTTFGGIATTVTDNTNGSEDGTLIFQTNGAGTFAERLRIQSGGGISFNGDTAAANALDDYEEGTWTPSILVNSSVSIGTVHQARYSKIGKTVTLCASFVVAADDPDSSDVRFGGFPFSLSLPSGGFPISINYNYKPTPTLFIADHGYVYYQNTNVGGNNQEPFGSALHSTQVVSMTFSYIVT